MMLEVRNLQVRYGAVTAVHGVSLDVAAGEVVGLVGPNGAGKSSTALAIVGLIRPSAGSINFDGRALGSMSTAGRVQAGLVLVPQGRQLFPNLSVMDNLRAGAWRVHKELDRTDVAGLLSSFPALQSRMSQPAGTLSGGEQQMLALARALASRPSFIVLDEPSMGLSPIMVDRVAEIVRQLVKDRNVTLLIVDQGLGLVRKVASRVLVMSHGLIVGQQDASDLRDTAALQAMYFH
jgi:branched-chain amino acid transport system ATP-binding protein